MTERVEVLERHVLGLDKEDPGLVLRVDRLERFAQALLWLAGLGCAFQVLEIIRAGIDAFSQPR